MKKAFWGRQTELKTLLNSSRKTHAFITIMGRRRIGKSELVAQFARLHYDTKNDIFYSFEGAWGSKSKTKDSKQRVLFQLTRFSEQFKSQFNIDISPKNWTEAFTLLQKFISTNQRVLLFFDEISWMADGESDSFRASLKTFWDTCNKSSQNIFFVVAGSVTAWIRDNILEDKGFYGRVTQNIILRELPINICDNFLGKHLNVHEKIAILMTIGGVPRYLEEMDPTCDSVANIQNTFFKAGHILNQDYQQIFEHTFHRKTTTYLKIIQSLLVKRPLSASEIKREINYQSSSIDKYIQDLVYAGFLRKVYYWQLQKDKNQGNSYYQICDNYIRFFLNYVQPNQNKIEQGIFELSSLEALENWDTIAGLQFENLVINSQHEVLSVLKLDNTIVKMYGNYYQSRTKKRQGCQIDLLIETSKSIFICEIKYKKKMGKEVVKEIENKLKALKTGQSLKGLNIFKVLIYSGTLSKDLHASDCFSHVINFEDLIITL